MRAFAPTLAAVLLAACTAARTAAPHPAAIAELEARVSARPDDGALLLELAGSQLAALQCGAAMPNARRGIELRPQDALGPLVLGECQEQSGDYEGAASTYAAFLAAYPSALGASSVAARQLLVRRQLATSDAKRRVAEEAQLAPGDADPNVVAVLPIEIVGDPDYSPLSIGLANLLIADLNLIGRFTLVERTQLDAVLAEIALSETGAVDPTTAVRAGRLMRAGTLVRGLTVVAPDDRLRLDVSVVDSASRIVGTESVGGKLGDLLRLEKELALALIARLGYQVSAAERAAILANGTQNLAAFLAYSRGLMDEREGNHAAAALNFARAVRNDPGFAQARESHRVNSAAATVQEAGPGAATRLSTARDVNAATVTTTAPTGGAVASGVQDVAPTLGEAIGGGTTGQQAGETSTAAAPAATSGILTRVFDFGIRFVFRFP
jgi:tetratricopeptide (TPR) repeat protein